MALIIAGNNRYPGKYPLLEGLLALRGLPLNATYTYRDAARTFDCSVRAIQERVRKGELTARNLPGRARFLAEDLERFLINSAKRSPTDAAAL